MLKSAIEEGRNVKEEVEIFSVQNGQTWPKKIRGQKNNNF